MSNEIEDAEKDIKGVMESLEGCSNAERIKALADKLEFLFMAVRFWGNAFKETKKTEEKTKELTNEEKVLIGRLMGMLEGHSDTECIALLIEKVRYWYKSSLSWSNLYFKLKEMSEEEDAKRYTRELQKAMETVSDITETREDE